MGAGAIMLWFIYTLAFLAGLVQTPILVDLLRVVFPEWKIKRLTSRAANVLLVILMTTFFCLGLGHQIYFFIRLLPEVPLRSAKLICHSMFAYWVWTNMIVNYFLAVFVHPGEEVVACRKQLDVGRDKKDGIDHGKLQVVEHRNSKEENDALSEPSQEEVESSSERTPQHGMEWNIKQSHYCKVCQTMVLYMDHHCPFTRNCVGVRNYAYFFLCLVYGTVGVSYGITVALLQAEGTRVCAHLYAERSRDVKIKCTEDRRIVYTHNYERYFGDCILPNVCLSLVVSRFNYE